LLFQRADRTLQTFFMAVGDPRDQRGKDSRHADGS
jgi:hypothetical protein